LIRRSKDLKNHKGRPASYDTAKDQLGMVAYQVRKWVGWHRHVTLCLLAAAFLAVTRASRGKPATPRKGQAVG
jgi:SRSO17 transposase